VSSLTPVQRRAIDLAKEGLVVGAETLLDDAKVQPSDDFGHSQLRNLEAVAAETESPAVVLNFIRYQMGRDQRQQQSWAQGPKDRRVGDLFIAALNDKDGAVAKALATVPDLDGKPTEQQLARMELIRYFLGFSTRYLRYLELKLGKRKRERRS
jgi:hypothetical protein